MARSCYHNIHLLLCAYLLVNWLKSGADMLSLINQVTLTLLLPVRSVMYGLPQVTTVLYNLLEKERTKLTCSSTTNHYLFFSCSKNNKNNNQACMLNNMFLILQF